jgi:hypothetical protein
VLRRKGERKKQHHFSEKRPTDEVKSFADLDRDRSRPNSNFNCVGRGPFHRSKNCEKSIWVLPGSEGGKNKVSFLEYQPTRRPKNQSSPVDVEEFVAA